MAADDYKVMESPSDLPNGDSWAVLVHDSFTKTIDYGPPDKPYTETQKYFRICVFRDQKSWEQFIGENEKKSSDKLTIIPVFMKKYKTVVTVGVTAATPEKTR